LLLDEATSPLDAELEHLGTGVPKSVNDVISILAGHFTRDSARKEQRNLKIETLKSDVSPLLLATGGWPPTKLE
jgi:hypothetical protein